MAQDISLLGAVYQDVPAVQLPLDGGGSALFVDVSADTVTADKLVYGYTAHNSNGAVTGTLKQLYVEPLAFDYIRGYTNSGIWNYQNSTNNRTDIYPVESGHRYYIGFGETVGTRFRAALITTNPIGGTENITGTAPVNLQSPKAYAYVVFACDIDGYLTVTKDNTGVSGIKTYLADITPN